MLVYNLTQALFVRFGKFNAITLLAMPVLRKEI